MGKGLQVSSFRSLNHLRPRNLCRLWKVDRSLKIPTNASRRILWEPNPIADNCLPSTLLLSECTNNVSGFYPSFIHRHYLQPFVVPPAFSAIGANHSGGKRRVFGYRPGRSGGCTKRVAELKMEREVLTGMDGRRESVTIALKNGVSEERGPGTSEGWYILTVDVRGPVLVHSKRA